MKRDSIYLTFVRLQGRSGQKTGSINITRKIVTESWKPKWVSYILSIWYQTELGGITFFLCLLLSHIKLLFAFYYISLYTLFNAIATFLYNPSFYTKSVWNETILIHDHDKLDRIKCSCYQPSDSANTYIQNSTDHWMWEFLYVPWVQGASWPCYLYTALIPAEQ